MKKYKCSICGYIHDEAAGTGWEDVSGGYTCPVCGAPKSVFKPLVEAAPSAPAITPVAHDDGDLRGLSAGEISVICSSLAKGCEKQRLLAEADAFVRIADYFKAKSHSESGKNLQDIKKMLDNDLAAGLASAKTAAKADSDRGAMRSLVWSEKVSTMCQALLERFAKEGETMLKNTKIYVCDICGFIYIGDTPPEICPVCKVPKFKILGVEVV